MAKLTRWHENILKTLEDIGLEIQNVKTKKHIVVQGSLHNQPFSWTTSATPSDRHVCKRQIADLKRELRKCGVEEPPQFAIRYVTGIPEPEDVWEEIWSVEAWLDKDIEREQSS